MTDTPLPKPQIMMLAAHEPQADPRVDWAATMAAHEFDVTVLGLQGWHEPGPESELKNGYRIRRFDRPRTVSAGFMILLAWAFSKSYLPGPGLRRVACCALIVVASVPLAVLAAILETVLRACVILVRAGRWIQRQILSAFMLLMPRYVFKIVGAVMKRLIRIRTISVSRANSKENRSKSMPGRLQSFLWTVRHVLTTADRFVTFMMTQPVQPDIIHCNDLDTLLAGVVVRRIHGVPVVYDSHENWPYSDVEAGWYHVWFFRLFERFLVRNVDRVVTVSDPLADVLRRAHKIDRVDVVPNAEPWQDHALIAKPGPMSESAQGRLKVLFQGTFAPQRGLEEVLDLWRDVDGTRAALFLRGPESPVRQRLLERARIHGLLDKSVYFLPPVTVDELVTAGVEADVGLIPYKPDLPNYIVACPNKLSQYMHAGLPILSVDLPYVTKVLTDGKCGLTYTLTERASFVNAVHKLANDRDLLARLSRNGLDHAQRVFNWQVQGSKFLSIYHELTNRLSADSSVGKSGPHKAT